MGLLTLGLVMRPYVKMSFTSPPVPHGPHSACNEDGCLKVWGCFWLIFSLMDWTVDCIVLLVKPVHLGNEDEVVVVW